MWPSRASAIAACLIAAVAAAGCSGSDGERSSTRVQRVTPPSRQLLAYTTSSAVYVLQGRNGRKVHDLPGGQRVRWLGWAGDGRHIALLLVAADDPGYDAGTLTLVDIRTRRAKSWPKVMPFGLMPGSDGIVQGSSADRFTEYHASGRMSEHRVTVPPTEESRKDVESHPTTDVAFAVPLAGRWLVAAESSSRQGAHGSPHRLFFYEPPNARLMLVGSDSSTYSVGESLRVSDRRMLWVAQSSGGACDSYNRLVDLAGQVPDLPDRKDGAWEIRAIAYGPNGPEVVARPLNGGFSEGLADCTPDTLQYQRMALRDDRWQMVERNIVDLDIANDGRTAVVRARSAGLRKGQFEPTLRYTGAQLTGPGATSIDLPSGTVAVAFSPAGAMAVPRPVPGAKSFTDRDRIESTSIGPWRLGDDPAAVEAATADAVQFSLNAGGCGAVRFEQPRTEERLGVIGHFVGRRLDWIEVTSKDEPVGFSEPLSDLQPDVASIKLRGPRTSRGVQAGEQLDRLIARHGPPSKTDERNGEAVQYVYRQGDGRLVATIDAASTIRRLELRRSATRGTCAGPKKSHP